MSKNSDSMKGTMLKREIKVFQWSNQERMKIGTTNLLKKQKSCLDFWKKKKWIKEENFKKRKELQTKKQPDKIISYLN